MNISEQMLIFGIGTIAAVVGSHVRLSTQFSAMKSDVELIKRKVINGTFVRRDECQHCRPYEEENGS